MTIEQIARKIIKDIKAWPEEARSSQDTGGPKTSWDEYKEQVQYEEYDSFEVFEETIESMVRDDVTDLSEKVIENLYRSRHTKDYDTTWEEKREDIVDAVFYHIKSEAETQEIEYSSMDTQYVRYNVDDLSIVAEVLSKVGPEEYIIRGYSEATGPGGEQGVANIEVLVDENGFEFITQDEFERAKQSLKPDGTKVKTTKEPSPPQEIKESEAQTIIVPIMEKKSEFSTQQEDQYQFDKQELKNYATEEKVIVNKGLIDLVNLLAKAFDKTPAEVLSKLKVALVDRKAKNDEHEKHQDTQKVNLGIITSQKEEVRTKINLNEVSGHSNYIFNPKIISAGVGLAGFHIEAGAKTYIDYSKAMVSDIGPSIEPYLKSFYNAVRDWPGFNAEGMDSYESLSKTDGSD